MSKGIGLWLAVAWLLWASPAWAYPQLQEEQELSVAAAGTLEPLDYAFFDSPGTGQLELYDLRGLEDGALLTVYLDTESGPAWLQLRFAAGAVEAWLPQQRRSLWNGPVAAISRRSPLTVSLRDGRLTVAVGGSGASLDGVKSFQGQFTTQGVAGHARVYSWQEKRRLLLA